MIKNRVKQMSHFSKMVLKAGFYLMLGYYIVVLFSIAIYPYATNRSANLAVRNGCIEAAPACLAVGVTAAVICDVVIQKEGLEEEDKKKKRK